MSSGIKNLCYKVLSHTEEILNNSFDHLQNQNPSVSYFQHFSHAMKLAKTSFVASFVFIVHAFYPDIFVTTGTTMLKSSLQEISEEKQK